MKRRELFAAGIAGTAVVGSACASPTSLTAPDGSRSALPVIDDDELAALLARVDDSMALLDHPEALPTIFRAHPHLRAHGSETAAHARGALKSLFMLSFFRDLPEETRFNASVQQRMWRAVPEMESALAGMAKLLGDMTPAQMAGATARLKADPGLPMRVCEVLDDTSRGAVSRGRRAHLRTMAAEISFRLQHQPPSLVVSELVEKYEKSLRGAPPRDARIGETIRAARHEPLWRPAPPPMRGDARLNGEDEMSPVVLTGLVVLGIGIVVFVGSGILALVLGSNGLPFLFGMTAGALLFVIGLIILAAAGVMWMLDEGQREQAFQERVNAALKDPIPPKPQQPAAPGAEPPPAEPSPPPQSEPKPEPQPEL